MYYRGVGSFFEVGGQDKKLFYLHPAKIDLDKKWLPNQKNIQNFNIDALDLRKTRNENPPTREIGVTS